MTPRRNSGSGRRTTAYRKLTQEYCDLRDSYARRTGSITLSTSSRVRTLGVYPLPWVARNYFICQSVDPPDDKHPSTGRALVMMRGLPFSGHDPSEDCLIHRREVLRLE